MTLTEVLHIIDTLNADELNQLEAHIQSRKQSLQTRHVDVDAVMQQLDTAVAEIRAGLTDEEIAEMVELMNIEHINPNTLKDYDWVDEETTS